MDINNMDRINNDEPEEMPMNTITYKLSPVLFAILLLLPTGSVQGAPDPLAGPVITSFSATPAMIDPGQSALLHWTVAGATSLTIDHEVGTVSGSQAAVSPTATTIYTLTAVGQGGTATSTAGVGVGSGSLVYQDVYDGALQDNWRIDNWGDPTTLPAASAPQRTGFAIETTFTADWQGFSLADIGDNWMHLTRHYYSNTKLLEFDIYLGGSGDAEALELLIDDAAVHNQTMLTDVIPGWDVMTTSERYGHWHHVAVTLANLQPQTASFFRFVLFNSISGARPHFFLTNVRLATITDLLPPLIRPGATTVDYDTLLLPFTTDEAATYRIDYGDGNYSQTFTGPAVIATNHSASFTGLTRGTTFHYRITATDSSDNQGVLTGSVPIIDPPPPTSASVVITIDPATTQPISPWIYGMNFYQWTSDYLDNLTLNRLGGNRFTAYNWENNASNAGNDWFYHNDGYLETSPVPGEAVRAILSTDRARGTAHLYTVPMLGYVAADKNGDDVTAVTPLSTRLATRFKQLVYRKPIATAGAFTTEPPTDDDFVYADEFVWAMNQLVPGGIYTDPTTPTFISLDNEPDLWSHTHAEISTNMPSPETYISNTISLAKAIKDVAPTVKIFGPAHFGFSGMVTWQMHPSFSGGYWFLDHYLQELKAASEADNRRLLDVFDIHWYPEATINGERVTTLTSATLSEEQAQTIVQSPRSLWDPTYTENSWIGQWYGGPILLLPRLRARIDAAWTNTDLAITEWNNGGANHIAGAIAVADNLGIFGQNGLFAANYWPLQAPSSATFDIAGFRMFRDYDGAQGSFGDTSLASASSDTAKVSAYVSRDSSAPTRIVIVAINRSNTSQAVGFNGLALAGHARLFRLTRASNVPTAVGESAIDLTRWLISLPGYSVTTIELTETVAANTYAAWRLINFTGTDLTTEAISGPRAKPANDNVPNLLKYAFNMIGSGAGQAATPQTFNAQTLSPFGFAGLPFGTLETPSSKLQITFIRRKASSNSGITYAVEFSNDLSLGSWATNPATTEDVTALDATFERVTITDSHSSAKRFARIKVTAP